MKLLNLGCGQNYHKDWINIDFVSSSDYVVPHNLLEGIPLNDESVSVVYHSHVLEHFSKMDGLNFMKECFRVLKPNGIIRIAVPDLETIAKEYLRNLELASLGDIGGKYNYEWIKLELLDQMVRNESGGEMKEYLFQSSVPNEKYIYSRIGLEGKTIRQAFLKNQNLVSTQINITAPKTSLLKRFMNRIKKYISNKLRKSKNEILTVEQRRALRIGKFRLNGEIHQWMYDRYSLTELLEKVGFKEIILCSAFESQIDNWEKYQLDVVDGEIRKPDSLFIEAKKS
ncbi:methyltransferase domain-containing protein [Salegentibacter sp. JZCK2]|uniref:class I SAM-dependent methyltransferase n=1 Tax=Salegentibacter tibetensis TaxID=2873600 RepID=UPI001CCDCEE7|nr:methyltransferase domain-containing protein [Salegentibacter tibetensis]MBZ9729740.1 methyltransferase domain-containing protein [Salegentibacter tibetensis]